MTATIMASRVCTVEAEATVGDAMTALRTRDGRWALVVRRGIVRGLVTDRALAGVDPGTRIADVPSDSGTTLVWV